MGPFGINLFSFSSFPRSSGSPVGGPLASEGAHFSPPTGGKGKMKRKCKEKGGKGAHLESEALRALRALLSTKKFKITPPLMCLSLVDRED